MAKNWKRFLSTLCALVMLLCTVLAMSAAEGTDIPSVEANALEDSQVSDTFDADAEAQRQAEAAAEEARRQAAEEEARRQAAEEEARRQAAEEEARRQAAEEEARRQAAEEEARRQAAEEEARRQAAEEEARRQAAEEEARRAAEEAAWSATTDPEPAAEPAPAADPEPAADPAPAADPEPAADPTPAADPEPAADPAPAADAEQPADPAPAAETPAEVAAPAAPAAPVPADPQQPVVEPDHTMWVGEQAECCIKAAGGQYIIRLLSAYTEQVYLDVESEYEMLLTVLDEKTGAAREYQNDEEGKLNIRFGATETTYLLTFKAESPEAFGDFKVDIYNEVVYNNRLILMNAATADSAATTEQPAQPDTPVVEEPVLPDEPETNDRIDNNNETADTQPDAPEATTQEPAENPAQEPAENPTQEPVEEPAQEPAEPTQEPVEEPVQEPVAEPEPAPVVNVSIATSDLSVMTAAGAQIAADIHGLSDEGAAAAALAADGRQGAKYTVFEISAEEEANGPFIVMAKMPEAVTGKAFKLYRVANGSAQLIGGATFKGGAENEDGMRTVQDLLFTADALAAYVVVYQDTAEALPVAEVAEPVEDTAEPAEEDAEPAEEDAEPTEEDAEPAEEDAEPTEEDAEPTEEDAEPAEEDAEPTEEDAEPTEEDAEPTEEDAEPAEEDAEPAEEDAEPAEEDGEPAEEDVEPAEAAAVELPEDRSVSFNITWDSDEPAFGDVAHFNAILQGYDGLNYTLQWQQSVDGENWEDLEGATDAAMDLEITEDNFMDSWRVRIFISLAPTD